MAKLTRKQFIEKLAPYAIINMFKTKVAASLIIAQGILESADGNSLLAIKANNLFGIKGIGTAGYIEMSTTEYINGKPQRVKARFRKYNNWGESVEDHSNLILNGTSWNRALYHSVIGKDGIEAAREVAKAGYATDPNYATKLITIIVDNNLQQYDKVSYSIAPVEKILTNLIDKVNELEIKLNIIEISSREISPPKWFIDEFPEALEILHQHTGTRDFWRSYAAALRTIKKLQEV